MNSIFGAGRIGVLINNYFERAGSRGGDCGGGRNIGESVDGGGRGIISSAIITVSSLNLVGV